MKFEDISNREEVMQILLNGMQEDIGTGDHSSNACIPENKISKAKLIFKDNGVAAGLSIACKLLRMNDPSCVITRLVEDGETVNNGETGFEVTGNARALLKSERLLLNILQRLSGIATVTRMAVEKTDGYNTKILDTRKTTPNLRILEKWAVTVGGGVNHRFGLFDMIMLKDNHIDIAGGIIPAIRMAKQYIQEHVPEIEIEVETRTLEEVKEVLKELPVKRIMLDNFKPADVESAVKLIDRRAETEASGGITLDNIESYAATGVDYISLGLITHSVKSLDISFKIML